MEMAMTFTRGELCCGAASFTPSGYGFSLSSPTPLAFKGGRQG